MRWKIHVVFGVLTLLLGACDGVMEGRGAPPEPAKEAAALKERDESSPLDMAELNRSLEELAEIERSGSFTRGMALVESGLRENAGDYAGAVAAAYKELAWAYGGGYIEKSALEQGLTNVLALGETGGGGDAARAAEGILAFAREQWDEAERILRSSFDEREEPDGFARWMILVCALEKNREDKPAASAYRSIRARYAQFPEYWYRGARAFTEAIAAEYAERCISLAPAGPFTAECRNILASFAGLNAEESSFLKSKSEIEDIIAHSVSLGNPEILSPLIPLISLPDNPYTIYALGALRALARTPQFRDYFISQAAASRGRLSERFAYICRG